MTDGDEHRVQDLPLLHKDATLLHKKVPALLDSCIDKGSLHLNFDPRDYVMWHTPLKYVLIPGSSSPKYIQMADDDGLKLLRSLPEFLNEMHKSGWCVSPATPLTLDNTAVSSDGRFRIRLDLVKFVRLEGLEGGSISADYCNAADVLEDLLRSCHGQFIMTNLRQDLTNWFQKLRACVNLECGYFVCNHSALLPMKNRGDAYLKIYKCVRYDCSIKTIGEVLNATPKEYTFEGQPQNWHDIAKNSNALKPWWNFQAYGDSKSELLVFHRNCLCHKESARLDIGLLLYVLYPHMLCSFQEGLCVAEPETHKKLKIEDNFKN